MGIFPLPVQGSICGHFPGDEGREREKRDDGDGRDGPFGGGEFTVTIVTTVTLDSALCFARSVCGSSHNEYRIHF